jgi:hypothetical protein
VIDALDQGMSALVSMPLPEREVSIRRSASGCSVATPSTLLRYELPSWTLRSSQQVVWPDGWGSYIVLGIHASAPVATGAQVRLVFQAREDGGPFKWGLAHWGATGERRVIELPFGGGPLAVTARKGWAAVALPSPEGIEVTLFDEGVLGRRWVCSLGRAQKVSLRLSDEALTVGDDRGRVVVVDLAHGDTVRDARVQ